MSEEQRAARAAARWPGRGVQAWGRELVRSAGVVERYAMGVGFGEHLSCAVERGAAVGCVLTAGLLSAMKGTRTERQSGH